MVIDWFIKSSFIENLKKKRLSSGAIWTLKENKIWYTHTEVEIIKIKDGIVTFKILDSEFVPSNLTQDVFEHLYKYKKKKVQKNN